MLVRSWNLFHGNTLPPQRRAFLDEMIALATRDDPDVLCVQEVPAWALGKFTVGDVAKRPLFGATIGRILTDINHGLLRSAFSGQGNAILLRPGLRVRSHTCLVLNPPDFRRAHGGDLDAKVRYRWGKERRVVQAVQLDADDGRRMLVANMHCTSNYPDKRPADRELLRAAQWVVSAAGAADVVVLAGDFNLTALNSPTLAALHTEEWGFSAPGPGIDHVLVRGAKVQPLRRWDDARREHDGRLLSDHAPVEVEFV